LAGTKSFHDEDEEDDALREPDTTKEQILPSGVHGEQSDATTYSSLALCQQSRCDMSTKSQTSEAQQTTSHDVIRKWAEERGGKPATVKATEEDGHAGILRIDFDPPDEGLDRISWDEFFAKFDETGIAFLHQDRTKDGKMSRFHKFVRR
jgi:hypothetical protein